jgi:GT2 family glycosyltransferase
LKTVAIVIPCLNEKDYILRCLQSIAQQSYNKDLITTYVCDGGSNDGTIEIIKDFVKSNNRFLILNNSKKTTPYALNLGITESSTDVVIILGAHSEVDNHFVAKNIETFSENEAIMCVGGVLENVYENETSKIIGSAMSSSFGVGNAHFRTGNKKGYVDTVAFGAYKREVFDKVGLFNEELIRNQDDEFNYRITSAGYKIFLNSEIKCKYFVRASFKKLYKQYYQYGYWKVYVNVLHKTVTTTRQLVPAAFVSYLFVLLLSLLIGIKVFCFFSLFLVLYLLMASFMAFRQNAQPITAIKIAYTFFILHFSYGMGYLKGIFDFILLKKSIKKHESLSR